ncbi:MAG TPA: choice-of-anchor D domain-containing protein [Pyrinomonadaceae bacterium]|nr:choice-of-anchor D domain-containing protein [Pyrinomonadaceae bacterium]
MNRSVAFTLGILLLLLLAGAGSAMAQKGGGGGGGLNTTTVSYTPSNYTLPPAGVGGSSSTTITLINTGSSPLSIKALAVSGAQATDFSLGGTCVGGVILQRLTTCTIQVTFAPLAVGSRIGTINATFLNATALNLPLTGRAVFPGPKFNVSPVAPFTFPSTQVGTAPSIFASELIIQMNNGGIQPVNYSYTFTGPNPGDFVSGRINPNIGGPCLPNLILGTGQQCGLGINFVPTGEGLRTTTMHIVSDDPANPVIDIVLSGVGTPGPTPTPTPAPTPIVSANDFTDLWGSATGEQDWNLSINHHKATTDALVAVWHTHDVDGSDMWLELKDGHWTDGLTFTGNLHRLKGTPFSFPNDPAQFTDTVVGTATLTFTDFANGTLSYTVNGISGSKTITRTTF